MNYPLEFLYVRITEGLDNGDSDNRGCMVALLVLINPKKFEKSVGFSVNLMCTLFIVM